MTIQAEAPRRTMVFVSIVNEQRPYTPLSEERRVLLASTTKQLRDKISLAKIFTANTMDGHDAAKLVQDIYGWDMDIEGSDLLGKDTSRSLVLYPEAYKIKGVISQKYDAAASPPKAVICIAEKAVIVGMLAGLAGTKVSMRMAEELHTGEAVIVPFDTNQWDDVGPFTVGDGAQLVQPFPDASPEQRAIFDLW